MKNLGLILVVIFSLFLLTGCGKDSPANKSSADQPRAATTAGGIEDYNPPDDVDTGVFEMLREEFLKQLGENPERTSASAPSGDAGKVTDLAYDSGTNMLTWTYVNLGDYNLSGDVSIADVAEIARYYLADATDGEGDDPFEAWVDGSGDGEVNIADVAPLATNYLNEVSEYVILTSVISDDGFFEIGRVDFSEAKIPSQTGVNFPKTFEVALPAGALNYIAVEPVDSSDNAGERSDSVGIPVEGPPVIVNVQPTHVEVDIPVVISAVITGAPITAYFWDFGGGADPGTSTVSEPLITPVNPGTHSCSLQAFNELGNDSYEFTFYVEEPPVIISVDPPWAAPDAPETFSATINGTPPLTFEWNFGGGATPSTSSEPSPTVMVGAAGVYQASLVVANVWGSDTLAFALPIGNWHVETLDSEGRVGFFSSIAVDSSGNLHISYLDATNYDLKYAYYDGASWQTEIVDSEGNVGSDTSIALDLSGHPHISYWEYIDIDPPDANLKYAYFDGTTWQIETADSGGSVGEHSSIAIDSSNYPHISYRDGTSNDLKYTYHNGASWQIETVDSEGNVGRWPSIAIDSDSRPHISYRDGTNYDLKYAYYNGASWQTVIVDSQGQVGDYTSIALDSSGNPHVSYYDLTSAALKYAYYDGASWQIETVDSEGDVGYYTSIALDSFNYPHITYLDGTNLDLKYAYFGGASWHSEILDAEGDVGFSTSIALDSLYNAHISYYDFTNEDLKYAFFG